MKKHSTTIITTLLLFLVLGVIVIILSAQAGAAYIPRTWDRTETRIEDMSRERVYEENIVKTSEAKVKASVEPIPIEGATYIGEATITHYCTELYKHACGLGHGVTASGRPVEAYVSCAVDPNVIPLGSTVILDYGDGELHYYRADDTGSGVDGNHVDLAVTYHDEALRLGLKRAKVWWK